jgi:hypothetical protein
MRFASIGGQSNYAQAGKAVADDAAKTFDVARKNSVDFGQLAQVAMKTRSDEKRAAMQAGAKVAATAADAKGYLKIKNMKAAGKRKAGMVAAAGMAGIGAADAFMGKEKPRDHSASIALQEKLTKSAEEIRAGIKPIEVDLKSTPTNTGGTGASNTSTTASTGGGLTSSAQAVQAGKGNTGSGGKYDLSAMTNYAIQGGFSPENARTMAAISMGESGGNAGIDTVQSGLDPNKSNEYSIGLAQINVQAHGAKLARRGWTEADLRDPVKNMTIAKEVYDEVGSFKPWSVYQKGLHHQYLQ